MMQVFHGKKISSLVAVVPRNETSFDDEWRNYGLTENKAKKYKEAMGFDRHRIAPPDVTSSDLCATGLRHLLEAGKLAKEDIGALLFISQTPDYFCRRRPMSCRAGSAWARCLCLTSTRAVPVLSWV